MAPLGDALAPDGAFSGSYDGRDHAIQGLTMPEGTKNAGLFLCIAAGGRVERVHLCDSEITGSLRAGGIAGSNSGTISACMVNDAADGALGLLSITATGIGALAGGIAAESSGMVEDCRTGAEVEVQSLKGSQSTGLSSRRRTYIRFTGIAG